MASTSIFAPKVDAIQPAVIFDLNKVIQIDINFSLQYNTKAEVAGAFITLIDPNISSINGKNSILNKNADTIIDKKCWQDKDMLHWNGERGQASIVTNSTDYQEIDINKITTNQFYQAQIYLIDINCPNLNSENFLTDEWVRENADYISAPSQVTLVRFLDPLKANIELPDSIYELPKTVTITLTTENGTPLREPMAYCTCILSNKVDGKSIVGKQYNCNNSFTFDVPIPGPLWESADNSAWELTVEIVSKHGLKLNTSKGFKLDFYPIASPAIGIINHWFNNGKGVLTIQETESNLANTYLQKQTEDSNWKDVKKWIGSENYSDYNIISGSIVNYRWLDKENSIIKKSLNLEVPTFEHIYLSDKTGGIVIRYDPKISDFQFVTQEALSNAIGSKFPIIRRNGHTYYRQFKLSGKIFIGDATSVANDHSYDNNVDANSFEVIDDNSCLLFNPQEWHPMIPNTEAAAITEQRLRCLAMEFLTNSSLKLFRSFEEGNMIVYLSKITFTPNATLGRHIYDFSATVTEACEYNDENLKKFNLLDCGYVNVAELLSNTK